MNVALSFFSCSLGIFGCFLFKLFNARVVYVTDDSIALLMGITVRESKNQALLGKRDFGLCDLWSHPLVSQIWPYIVCSTY